MGSHDDAWIVPWRRAQIRRLLFLHPALLVPAVGYGIGFFVAVRWPSLAWPMMAAGNGLLTVTLAKVWGRAVFVDMIQARRASRAPDARARQRDASQSS